MSKAIITASLLTDIADAIRAKTGGTASMTPAEMADEIEDISTGGITPTGTLSITENGTHDVTNYASVNVNVPSGGITPTGTKQISITANGNTTEDVTAYANAEITVNVPTGGGGGSGDYETGILTLASDLSLTNSPQNIPGLQFGFQPDFFYIVPERASFEARESYSGGLWSVMAIRKSLVAPFAQNATNTPEAVTTNDYVFFINTSLFANTSITCGQGLSGVGAFLGNSYYNGFTINSDGTVSVRRYSSAATKMFAGDYRYFACKV